MKPHKHAELIKAWADGTIIQYKDFNDDWADCVCNLPVWNLNTEYRIKPEPKPDIVVTRKVTNENNDFCAWVTGDANLKLTFCGETNKLKLAEVIK